MAVTLVHTPGAANANSYVSLADALLWFEKRLYQQAWSTAYDDDDRKRALIMATRDLDAGVNWDIEMTGWRTTTTQALEFPRAAVQTRSGDAYYGVTVIPPFLVDACCEQALAHLRGDRTGDPQARGIRSIAVGSIDIEYDPSSSQVIYPLVDDALRFVGPWALNAGAQQPNALRNVELVRV